MAENWSQNGTLEHPVNQSEKALDRAGNSLS